MEAFDPGIAALTHPLCVCFSHWAYEHAYPYRKPVLSVPQSNWMTSDSLYLSEICAPAHPSAPPKPWAQPQTHTQDSDLCSQPPESQ